MGQAESSDYQDPEKQGARDRNPGPPVEANDPFGMHRFSLHRYSVRHMLLLFLAVLLMASMTVTAALSGAWMMLALAGAGLIVISTVMTLMLRMAVRRVIIERWIRRLGMGDFEYKVEPWGRDELSKVCIALETLRMRAITAMQLNEVQRLSEQLQQKNEELESALSDLHRTQDRIVSRRKVAELGELAAGLAHEIRNPLQFIKNFAEGSVSAASDLQEDDAALPLEKRELVQDITDNMRRIIQHSDRANRIISQMIAMGRQENAEFRNVAINALLAEQTGLAIQAAKAQNLELEIEIIDDMDPEAGDVSIIPEDMSRVFTNLVSNACLATTEKALEYSEPGYSPTIRIGTKRKDGEVTITVWDNGFGMTPEVMEKMFNPFFTTRPNNQATGLGLSLSHDIVQMHGGTITADSQPGQYTTMIVTLLGR